MIIHLERLRCHGIAREVLLDCFQGPVQHDVEHNCSDKEKDHEYQRSSCFATGSCANGEETNETYFGQVHSSSELLKRFAVCAALRVDAERVHCIEQIVAEDEV